MTLARWAARAATLMLATALAGCGYNDFQRLDEQVKAGWSEVLNQYQRRSDLIPNIVNTVKGERIGFSNGIGFSVLPDYLWADNGQPERLTRVAHRGGRA